MKSATVAVVDDHERVRDSIARLLLVADFQVETFRSAEEFLSHCKESGWTRLSCLVLDVRLPGMSGTELQGELTDRNIRIPVVLISGHATREVTDLGRKNGAAAMLEKPFDGEKLVDEVNKAMGSAPAGF